MTSADMTSADMTPADMGPAGMGSTDRGFAFTKSAAIRSGVIDRWLSGWAALRGFPEPERGLSSKDSVERWRCRMGLPNRECETFLAVPAGAQFPRSTAEELARRSDAWLSVFCTDAEPIRQELLRAGLNVREQPEALMVLKRLDHAAVVTPSGYLIHVDSEARRGRAQITADKLTAAVTHRGAVVASGQACVAGDTMIADRILTDPAHRRKGLARAVMNALTEYSYRQGARQGVLVASATGQRLYSALGWDYHLRLVVGQGAGPEKAAAPGV